MPEEPLENAAKQARFRRLVETGTEIAGGAVGGALGFLAGGPEGAAFLGAGGVVAAKVLRRIGEEVSERWLSPREQARVGGVIALTAQEMRQRIELGQQIRMDGFFEQSEGHRSNATEVAESVLLKCQREPEERKLPFMAHLLANIAFDASISSHMAHQLIKIADSLTYRQLCLLRIGAIRIELNLRATDYRGQGSFNKDLYQVLYECHDLYNRGLVSFGGEVGFGPTDVIPAQMNPQGIGADLHNTMKLASIPSSDLMPIISQLS